MGDDTNPRITRYEATLPGVGSRRTDQRYTFHAKIEALPLDGRRPLVRGTTEDISHRGVFVRSRRRLPIESLLVLMIHTPHGSLKLSARVIHNIEGIGFGCEFIDLDAKQREALSLLVSMKASAPRTCRSIH